ncbi:MAG: hypothetical protein CML29_13475 [Rhizobiales bacterium]|nr:hypothetical protein [Hyphomicrobiales bacterium]MBA69848.1 hypothetical protein [Hyphomicrobiales bacterium]
MNRIETFAAGLLGISGVAAAALSAHAGSDPRMMGAVALICLAHAPALLAIGVSGRREVLLRFAALLLFFGAALFGSDLALREYGHGRLFPMAAPTGGVTMMAGWLLAGLSALFARRA